MPAKEAQGKVKWFDYKKGFGFIIPDDGSDEIMIHNKTVRAAHIDMLLELEPVTVLYDETGKGRRAIEITKHEARSAGVRRCVEALEKAAHGKQDERDRALFLEAAGICRVIAGKERAA